MAAQIMYFALGFLVATLITLAVLPALNARAKRLARRRIEAMLPTSLEEIAAERDLIRAEGAVAVNQKDQVIARKDEDLHKHMLELSRSKTEIEQLQASLASVGKQLEAARLRGIELEKQAASSLGNAELSRRIEQLADRLMATEKAE